MLKDLSIVIPTYNRQQYALRNIHYWSNRGPEIHVLDGSALPVRDELLSSVGPNIHYHHWPISMISRISKVREVLTTPYTALMGDDEFYLPSGLKDSIEVLETEQEWVSVMGRCIIFNPIGDNIYSSKGYEKQANRRIDQESPAERMLFHFSDYTPSTIYSVVRTEVWKQAWEATARKEFSMLGQIELQFEQSVCFLGKSIVIPSLVWLRSQENGSVESPDKSLQIKTGIHLSEWWIKPEHKEEREEFLDIFESALSTDVTTRFRESLSKAITVYSKKCINDKENQRLIQQKHSLRNLLLQIKLQVTQKIPIKIKIYIKQLPFIPKRGVQKMDEVLNSFERSGISVHWEEIEDVKKTILAFHREI